MGCRVVGGGQPSQRGCRGHRVGSPPSKVAFGGLRQRSDRHSRLWSWGRGSAKGTAALWGAVLSGAKPRIKAVSRSVWRPPWCLGRGVSRQQEPPGLPGPHFTPVMGGRCQRMVTWTVWGGGARTPLTTPRDRGREVSSAIVQICGKGVPGRA